MKRRISIIAVVASLIAVTAFTLVNNKRHIDAAGKVVDRSEHPVAVTVVKAAYQQADGTLQLPAVLEPTRQADISSSAPGKINNLRIALGSSVTEGQVVGFVNTSQQQLSLKEAQVAMAKAAADYQRNKELYEGGAGTAQSVKEAQHAYESARIQAEQIGHQVGEGAIKAPISGIVVKKNKEAGEYTNPGAVIATVVDVYTLKAVVFVSEKDVYSLQLNGAASITTGVLPGKSIHGKVTFISPLGDENHNYRVELLVNNSAALLKAGTYIKVAFDLGKSLTVLQVPKLALVEGTKNPYVYLIKGGKAWVHKIAAGRELGENIEVLSGLEAGDEVVVNGHINLINGSKITKTTKNP